MTRLGRFALDRLVTGCGRSGTGFMANLLAETGVQCGHEAIFQPTGPIAHKTLHNESSWYAAPFVRDLPPEVKILHVVREPRRVMASFYKIGMLARFPCQHITMGHPIRFLRNTLRNRNEGLDRIRYVAAHRRFLRQHTTIFSARNEEKRLEAYWRDWNLMIETAAEEAGLPYLRIRIEDIDTEMDKVCDFLDLPTAPVQTETIARNHKSYRRTVPDTFNLSPDVQELAERYGY